MKNLTLPLFSANSSLDRAFMQSESSDWFAFWLHGSKHYPVYLLSKQGAFWSSTPNLVSLTSRRDCTSLCKSYCPGKCLRVRTEPVIIISGFLRSHAEAVWLSLEGWGLVRRQLLGNWHYKDTLRCQTSITLLQWRICCIIPFILVAFTRLEEWFRHNLTPGVAACLCAVRVAKDYATA